MEKFNPLFALCVNFHMIMLNPPSGFTVQDVQSEGRTAIDSPGKPNAPEVPPEEYALRKSEKQWPNHLN